jgi:hypothetical protein
VPKRRPALTSPDQNMSHITTPAVPRVGFVSLG